MEALGARTRAVVMRGAHSLPRIAAFGFFLLVLLLAVAPPAHAQIGSDRYSSIVIDAANGAVLSAVHPDEPRYPASLTKMMTLYMVFEALRDRRLTLDTPVPVSAHAASMSPSKLGLTPETHLTLQQAILALVTKSANDAASAIGELLGGDEARFAQMMTLRARALGMSHTTFRNASGLPDSQQVSTARDLAILARHLVQDFPNEYHYFSVPSFVFHGRTILNHDHLLQTYPGADGIKTGYIGAAGFNLVTSAVRDNVRLIGVVLGAARPGARDVQMAALLNQGFTEMNVPVGPRGEREREWAHHGGGGLIASAQAATLDSGPMTPTPPTAHPARIWALHSAPLPSEAAARSAAAVARRGTGAGEAHIEPAGTRRHPRWRVRLAVLTHAEARAGCAALARRHVGCIWGRGEDSDYASR